LSLPLSVVISTYSISRYNDLINVLASLKNQKFKKFEAIVIVDENKRYYLNLLQYVNKEELDNTKVIFNRVNKGLAYSRNLGIKHSKGRIIAYLDDDVVVDPNWAKEIVRPFYKHDNVGGVAGHILPLWIDKDMEWFPEELYWMISCSYVLTPKRESEIDRGFGANMAFRKDLLLKLGGFRTDLGLKKGKWIGGEDTDMFLRIRESGYKVIFNPKAVVYHKIYPNRIKLSNIIKRSFGGGISVALMGKTSNYNPQKYKEKVYLKELIYHFYPKKIVQITKHPSTILLKQMGAVTLTIIFEGIGYLRGRLIGGKI